MKLMIMYLMRISYFSIESFPYTHVTIKKTDLNLESMLAGLHVSVYNLWYTFLEFLGIFGAGHLEGS